MVSRHSVFAAVCGLGVFGGALVAHAGYTPPPTDKFQPVRPRVIPDPSWGNNALGLSHTFTSFNQVVPSTPISVPLAGAPAGTYTGYTVTVDWAAIAGDPWSSEGIFAFTDSTDLNTAVFHADPGSAPNSQNNGNPITLTWNGFMDVPYQGGNPFHMFMLQTFGGSSANWNNVSVTINDNVPVAPPSTPAFVGGSISTTLAAAEVKWYSFDYSGSGALDLNTVGSNLFDPNATFQNDTEIGLYASSGTLVDTNDDIDFSGGNYLSQLTFADGELPAGTYYLAVGGFNTDFGPAFAVSSTSAMTGSLNINGISIPEPASLGMLALVGVFARRRRH